MANNGLLGNALVVPEVSGIIWTGRPRQYLSLIHI
jgi:hypothetical protein